jgi:hypothetical protein
MLDRQKGEIAQMDRSGEIKRTPFLAGISFPKLD